LYTFTAGSSTPQTTYTTSVGNVSNSNPIELGSTGYPSSGGNIVSIWLTAGVSYKFTLKTSAGVDIWSRDNISGVNDTTSSVDQWVAGPAPTYVSATSFTLVGDQTATFHVGRRLKTTNSGGTVYSTISATAFGAVTTVTVVNDSGTLDSGLSAVSYGLLSAVNPSTPITGLTLSAEQATTSGTAITFSGIPYWAKRITVNFSGVSTNASDALRIQIGDAGGLESSGYLSTASGLTNGGAVVVSQSSGAFLVSTAGVAGSAWYGSAVLTLQDSSDNTWCIQGALSAGTLACSFSGGKPLSATLTQLAIDGSAGGTFDAGAASIIYE
jgi:hypothetical protein